MQHQALKCRIEIDRELSQGAYAGGVVRSQHVMAEDRLALRGRADLYIAEAYSLGFQDFRGGWSLHRRDPARRRTLAESLRRALRLVFITTRHRGRRKLLGPTEAGRGKPPDSDQHEQASRRQDPGVGRRADIPAGDSLADRSVVPAGDSLADRSVVPAGDSLAD